MTVNNSGKYSDQLDISVIIPFHNRMDLTAACLQSLAENRPKCRIEYVLVDDASDEVIDPSAWLPAGSWRILCNETRKSYSYNNNAGAAIAAGRYLCLLNNDTEVLPGWLDTMLAAANRIPRLGVLGNKHLFPKSRLLHHAGMAFADDGEPIHLHPGTDPDAPAVNYARNVSCVTFACALIPKLVYDELGGLDESYRNGYEDVDFCLRARTAGYLVHYTPASVILHHGQATPGRKGTDETNATLFRTRWQGKYAHDLTNITKEDRKLNQQRKAMARHHNTRSGGIHFAVDFSRANAFSWAMVELIRALHRRGAKVSIPSATTLHDSIGRNAARELQNLKSGKPFQDVHVKWSHYWSSHLRQPLNGDINAEFFCTNYRYREKNRFLDLWLRHVQLNGFRKLPVARFNLDALLEVGISEDSCAIVPLGYAPEIDDLYPLNMIDPPQSNRSDIHILLVTNSHDLPRYGTDLAIKALAAAYGPNDPVVVHIKDYGAHAGSALKSIIASQPRFPRVEWHNKFLSKRELIHLYAKMDVQLAPFRGEGFAMKILDAMALGVPAIMPLFGGPTEFATIDSCLVIPHGEVEVGACYDRDAFPLGRGAWWCEPDLSSLIETLRLLPNNMDICRQKGRVAQRAVRGHFSWERAADKFMAAISYWSAARKEIISCRRAPDAYDLSVIIPTKDRPDQLHRTLKAYENQTLAADRYELLVVNDYGSTTNLKETLANFPGLPLKLLHNDSEPGPGQARNTGIEKARGKVIVITGDDIVPVPEFLESHDKAHQRFSELEAAFVGKTLWHPDLEQTPFLAHITGEGGQQFRYDDMQPWKTVPFDRFYTSNCSIKRAFISEEERLFSEYYRFAAYEDVEFGYRLHLRGMSLRLNPEAIGFHHHAMSPNSFMNRQMRVGKMLAVLALQRPDYMPACHFAWLEALEFMRSQPKLIASLTEDDHIHPDMLIRELVALCEVNMGVERALSGINDPAFARHAAPQWAKWHKDGFTKTWEALNELILRLSMASEWSQDDEILGKAGQAWACLAVLPKITRAPDFTLDIPLAGSRISGAWSRKHPHLAAFIEKALSVPVAARLAQKTAPVARKILKL